ncbi:MAG: nitroreductase family deazaflavin-dependent oxidoreductase [Actinomycetota bacterium]
MPLHGEYVPSPREYVRKQVEEFESSDGTRGHLMRGYPIVVITMRGARSGTLRKVPLMRVEHGGRYAIIASMGGAPTHPLWYHNLKAHPEAVLQDGAQRIDVLARELEGEERPEWWERAVTAFPDYADYQRRTDRLIPVFLLEPAPPVRDFAP